MMIARRAGGGVITAAVLSLALSGIGALAGATRAPNTRVQSSSNLIRTVGAENEYGNVLSQIGGKYVTVASILNNPSTDPHTFESSAAISSEVSAAQLIVQNGVGYDAFMTKIESASPSAMRKVITVQTLLGLPAKTPNPHLWYKPTTMPIVAKAIAVALSSLQPSHGAYFRANLATFDHSLQALTSAINAFRVTHAGTPVATTEPVADYLLQAMGVDNLTPFGFQADIMNGIDPSPQDITFQDRLFSNHKVKAFIYNQQVVSSLTSSIRGLAKKAAIPVVGVYETMPTPGYNYQSWMLAEVKAIERAVTNKVSTEKL
jgi:zinc/manganese transport system substrate-binding protein